MHRTQSDYPSTYYSVGFIEPLTVATADTEAASGFLDNQTGGTQGTHFMKPDDWHITFACTTEAQVGSDEHYPFHAYTQGNSQKKAEHEGHVYSRHNCFPILQDQANRGKKGGDKEQWPDEVDEVGRFSTKTLASKDVSPDPPLADIITRSETWQCWCNAPDCAKVGSPGPEKL